MSATAQVVLSVTGIGKSLSLTVVAEGIESAVQRDILKAQGYEVGQGNFFSEPLPGQAFVQFIDSVNAGAMAWNGAGSLCVGAGFSS